MARTGEVNGFYFDKEVFTDYMQEQSCLNNLLIASGVLMYDPIIEEALGGKNNVATIPSFLSIDNESDALNDDGETNNTPTELTGNKQTLMAIARMKAWKEKTYTRYLTGVSPLKNLANNLVVPYWTNQWEKVIFSILKGIMGTTGMATHKLDLSVTTGTITDANKIDLTTHIDLGQQALGDKRNNFALMIAHSQVAANLKKKEIAESGKIFSEVLGIDIKVYKVGNMVLLETDTGTVDTTVAQFPVYSTYMLGRGTFLTCPKTVHNPYDVKYDPEDSGGVEKLYTKQARVLHPNGFSLKVDNIAKESPTNTELETATNWELRINHKNVPIALIKSNG
ncbi:hypothetical protein KEC48_03485 [Clostridium sp. C1]|uniref:major capsid protein n=1 Tax=Clostridium sp. C1 TaxID=1155388 RepID=UPI001BA5448B|nr:major capsid protein [Clostridium sp. C1]QUN13600.1 hypothetical protein KEC48_03485 [Clostridium sp. C1]